MKKLTKTQVTARDKHAEDIRNAIAELNGDIEIYNKAIEEAKSNLEPAITKLNECLEAARNWRDEVVAEMDDYAGNRSEKWSEGDAGQTFESWKQEFENLELEDVEIEFPEELDVVEDDRSEAVDNLPEVAE